DYIVLTSAILKFSGANDGKFVARNASPQARSSQTYRVVQQHFLQSDKSWCHQGWSSHWPTNEGMASERNPGLHSIVHSKT
ncbi:MAG TPA: hypothetical protein VK832_00265, partial [Burkholderiaceae bacterium]|nr:hypothetical protein [Burkholderiaceae bacterium]